jgi:Ca-activated chloride channel family protein
VNIEFENPQFLLLLLLVPPLLLWRGVGRPTEGSLGFGSVSLLRDLAPTWRVRYRPALVPLRALALVLLVLALARPQSGQAEALVPAEGIDIVLALDTSSSMSQTTLGERTRLDVARSVLAEFVRGRENDRLGLVVFRSQSLVVSPLTLDYQALGALLKDADGGALPDGTAVGLAVADSLNLLRDSRARSRIVILLTDGENNQHEVEPLAAARIAEALKVRVYTVGVVDAPEGRPVTSQLNVDESALEKMAEVTGGSYYRASSPETLAQIYDEIGRLEKSRVGQKRFAAFDERAAYFLVPGLALLALEVLLASTVFRRIP